MLKRSSTHYWLVVLVTILLFLSTFLAFAKNFLETEDFKNLEPAQQRAIELIVKNKEVKTFLKDFPDWWAEVYQDGETFWHVDFYEGDEWLAYAHIDTETREVSETKFPEHLSKEEFAKRKEQIEKIAFNDAELLALLANPDDWDYEVQYDAYEETWWMNFWRGIDALTVDFYPDEKSFYIDRIYDPEALNEEEAKRVARDQAIELAWQAEDIGVALDGHDNWHTYAEWQEGSRWTVSFDTRKKQLFSALVDIEVWEVLETHKGN